MWKAVRELIPKRRRDTGVTTGTVNASQANGMSNIDFEDMMEIYDAEIDDDLEKLKARRQPIDETPHNTNDINRGVTFDGGRPNFKQHRNRVCRRCAKPGCNNEQCLRRLDSDVEEDGEVTPMLGGVDRRQDSIVSRSSGESVVYDTVPVVDDPTRTDHRCSSMSASDGQPKYVSNTSPSEPVVLPTSIDPEAPNPIEAKSTSINRYHHPGEGASPLIPETEHEFYNPCMEKLRLSFLSPETKPATFFRHLLKAIKNNNIHAVDTMCESVLTNNVDLSDTSKFVEKHYTATALHVALLYKRSKIAQKLIFTCPKLVNIPYTSPYLRGQTSFHIAAANNDIQTMKLMLRQMGSGNEGDEKRRKALDERATGTYFEKSHHEGALCLTAAIWAGNIEMVELLFRNGASMDRMGPYGNTALHHLIFFSDEYPERQDKARALFELFWEYSDDWLAGNSGGFTRVENCDQKALKNKVEAMRLLLGIRNHDEQTPLTLAVNLQAPIAKYLLNFKNLYRMPQTKFGSTAWITYDVTDVTSYGTGDRSWIRYNPYSILHILAHRAKIVSTDDKTFEDLIETQPIIDLVKMKWNVYKWIYYIWCLLHLTYMGVLTWYATHYTPSSPCLIRNKAFNDSTDNYNIDDNLNLTSGMNMTIGNNDNSIQEQPMKSHHPWIFLIVPIIYFAMELEDIIFVSYRSLRSLTTSKGFIKSWAFLMEQWTVTGNGPFRVLSLLFSGALFTWAILYELNIVHQDIALSGALIFGWVFMLFFTRAIKSTSRFSIMVQKMFFQDFLYFLSVYSFVWMAFASAMQALIHADQRNRIDIGDTLYFMLNIVTDAGEKATEETARVPLVAAVLLSCYAVISVILLLNMLIAMMNASYDAVKMSKTNLYRYQQLSILLMIERRLFWWRKLCERSQRRLWSPKTTLTDHLDGKEKPLQRGIDDIELQVKTKKRKLAPKRIYMEVTERNLTEDDSIYKPYMRT